MSLALQLRAVDYRGARVVEVSEVDVVCGGVDLDADRARWHRDRRRSLGVALRGVAGVAVACVDQRYGSRGEREAFGRVCGVRGRVDGDPDRPVRVWEVDRRRRLTGASRGVARVAVRGVDHRDGVRRRGWSHRRCGWLRRPRRPPGSGRPRPSGWRSKSERRTPRCRPAWQCLPSMMLT